MTWHENLKPAMQRADRRRARRRFVLALREINLSQEEKENLTKLFDQGR